MVTDFHSHILPGIDDGSASLEESIALLRMEAEQGVEHVVATPHFYPNYQSPEAFLEKRDRAEQLLREEMRNHEGLPRLSVGAEVYFFHGMSQSDTIQLLTIDKNPCILLEMPEYAWTESMYREIADIRQQQGITPIIAHVDRYIHPVLGSKIPKTLETMPVMVQANASFFLRRATVGRACRMLQQGQIHLLGSDCHNLTSRVPNLESAVSCIRKRVGDAAIAQIKQNEASVIHV